jgi:L-asparaginase / beta-aspartyl-peptidase
MATLKNPPLIPYKRNNGQKFVLVIHGGSGSVSRTKPTPEVQPLYKAALKSALEAGYAVLREGGEAMDAAVAAVTVLEGEFRLRMAGRSP